MPETPRPGEYQSSKQTAAEETAGRLADKAERLLQQAMRPTNLTVGKHKWATGKEKWQALQSEGAKAAGKKRGRPKAPPPSPESQLVTFLTRLENYQKWILEGTYGPMQLTPERDDLLRVRLELVLLGQLTPELVLVSEQILNPTNE